MTCTHVYGDMLTYIRAPLPSQLRQPHGIYIYPELCIGRGTSAYAFAFCEPTPGAVRGTWQRELYVALSA